MKKYKRQVVYFFTYDNKEKQEDCGYATIYIRGELCEIQMYYREEPGEGKKEIRSVFLFRDGSAVEGETGEVREGMGVIGVNTASEDFLGTGRSVETLEAIYIDGTGTGICGGRIDGQDLFGEDTYSVTRWLDTVSDVMEQGDDAVFEEPAEYCPEPECWSFSDFMERLPEMKLPFDGIRKKCCRLTLEDMEHLPKELATLKENHFLLHGYYEYHHVLLARLCGRHGEHFAVGVPGEYGNRQQYMAESFGFSDFAPLEQGKRHRGSFGYWYYYCPRTEALGR